ncbi:MAG: response regulator [Abditibacteriales bacterium]|nr:response regulator [Abditibacteriales bacterium]MDW8366046.1 response regulator [Abditibacteriales bacterium]
MPTIHIVIADADVESRRNLADLIRAEQSLQLIGQAGDGREGLELVHEQRPDILLVDTHIAGSDSAAIIERLRTQYPDMGIIVLTHEARPEEMRRMMRAGAHDFLVKPIAREDLMESVREVYSTLQKIRHLQEAQKDAPRSMIITVFSPQGGAGKSVLAANLAVALRQQLPTHDGVVLVDLNLQFGDIDLVLNLAAENSIAGLAQKHQSGELDPETVESYLTTHTDTGLKVLVAPSTPEYAETVTVYTVEQVLNALQSQYAYIVVDTPSQLTDTTFVAFDFSQTILLLTTLDLLAIHKTRTALDRLRQLYPAEKIKLVLNRANSQVGITVSDVEGILDMPITAHIPSDGHVVVKSVNEGIPFVLSAPDSAIAQSVMDLSRNLLGKEVATVATADKASHKSRASFWRLLFGE